MVARHIPTLMAIGAVLAAYRLLGVGDVFKELIKKDLQPAYDYVIGLPLTLSYIEILCRLCVMNRTRDSKVTTFNPYRQTQTDATLPQKVLLR